LALGDDEADLVLPPSCMQEGSATVDVKKEDREKYARDLQWSEFTFALFCIRSRNEAF